MEIKTSVETLKEYLEGICGANDGKINEAILEATPEGLVCCTKNHEATRVVKAIIKSSAFAFYKAQEGEYLASSNLDKLLSYLGRFKKEITIQADKNRMVIREGTKEATIVMPDKDYVQVASFNKEIPFTHQFETDASLLQESISNANAIGKDAYYEIEIVDGKLAISAGDKQMDFFVEKAQIAGVGNVKTHFKSGFESIIVGASGKINVSLMDKGPIQVQFEKKGMSFTNICAPFAAEPEEEIKGE